MGSDKKSRKLFKKAKKAADQQQKAQSKNTLRKQIEGKDDFIVQPPNKQRLKPKLNLD